MDLVVFGIERHVFVGVVIEDIERAEILEFAFPEHPPGVHITCAQRVHPLNEQPAADHLFRWSMTMTGKHVGIAAAAEPQQSKRKSYASVVGLDRVGDVSILVGPVIRAGQAPPAA